MRGPSGQSHGREASDTLSASAQFSVATLLLLKSTIFTIKKTLDSQKNTTIQKQTNTQWKCPENALHCNANHRHFANSLETRDIENRR